jgi:hypothetical protein
MSTPVFTFLLSCVCLACAGLTHNMSMQIHLSTCAVLFLIVCGFSRLEDIIHDGPHQ